jgi:SnoaL-like domain
MSQENVELSLLAIDAWNRRDVEANVALSDPEIVWYPALEGITEGRTYRGHAGQRQYYKDLAEFSEEGHVEFDEVHDLGDQVLSLGRIWFRFASGVELDLARGLVLRSCRSEAAHDNGPEQTSASRRRRFADRRRRYDASEILRGRCRRRTSRSSRKPSQHGTGATWMP